MYGIQNSRTNDLKKKCMLKQTLGINCILREIFKYLIEIITLPYNLPAYTFEIPDQILVIQITFLVQELFTYTPMKPFLGGHHHFYTVDSFLQILTSKF